MFMLLILQSWTDMISSKILILSTGGRKSQTSIRNVGHRIICRDVTVPDSSARSRGVSSVDDIDARGTFNKEEARREFSRLSRGELEGRLGLSSHKVEDILNRAEKRSQRRHRDLKPGVIHYKVFLGGCRNHCMDMCNKIKVGERTFLVMTLVLKVRKLN